MKNRSMDRQDSNIEHYSNHTNSYNSKKFMPGSRFGLSFRLLRFFGLARFYSFDSIRVIPFGRYGVPDCIQVIAE